MRMDVSNTHNHHNLQPCSILSDLSGTRRYSPNCSVGAWDPQTGVKTLNNDAVSRHRQNKQSVQSSMHHDCTSRKRKRHRPRENGDISCEDLEMEEQARWRSTNKMFLVPPSLSSSTSRVSTLTNTPQKQCAVKMCAAAVHAAGEKQQQQTNESSPHHHAACPSMSGVDNGNTAATMMADLYGNKNAVDPHQPMVTGKPIILRGVESLSKRRITMEGRGIGREYHRHGTTTNTTHKHSRNSNGSLVRSGDGICEMDRPRLTRGVSERDDEDEAKYHHHHSHKRATRASEVDGGVGGFQMVTVCPSMAPIGSYHPYCTTSPALDTTAAYRVPEIKGFEESSWESITSSSNEIPMSVHALGSATKPVACSASISLRSFPSLVPSVSSSSSSVVYPCGVDSSPIEQSEACGTELRERVAWLEKEVRDVVTKCTEQIGRLEGDLKEVKRGMDMMRVAMEKLAQGMSLGKRTGLDSLRDVQAVLQQALPLVPSQHGVPVQHGVSAKPGVPSQPGIPSPGVHVQNQSHPVNTVRRSFSISSSRCSPTTSMPSLMPTGALSFSAVATPETPQPKYREHRDDVHASCTHTAVVSPEGDAELDPSLSRPDQYPHAATALCDPYSVIKRPSVSYSMKHSRAYAAPFPSTGNDCVLQTTTFSSSVYPDKSSKEKVFSQTGTTRYEDGSYSPRPECGGAITPLPISTKMGMREVDSSPSPLTHRSSNGNAPSKGECEQSEEGRKWRSCLEQGQKSKGDAEEEVDAVYTVHQHHQPLEGGKSPRQSQRRASWSPRFSSRDRQLRFQRGKNDRQRFEYRGDCRRGSKEPRLRLRRAERRRSRCDRLSVRTTQQERVITEDADLRPQSNLVEIYIENQHGKLGQKRREICQRIGLHPEQLVEIGYAKCDPTSGILFSLVSSVQADAVVALMRAAGYVAGYHTDQVDIEDQASRRVRLNGIRRNAKDIDARRWAREQLDRYHSAAAATRSAAAAAAAAADSSTTATESTGIIRINKQ